MKCTFLLALLCIFNFSKAQTSQFININDTIDLKLLESVFIEKEHDIKFKNGLVLTINNRLAFGNDMSIPKTVLDSAILYIKNEKIELDVSGLFDPNIKLFHFYSVYRI